MSKDSSILHFDDARDDASERLAQERARLISSLGALTDGGVIEQIEPIGAASVSGLPTRSFIDVALAVWPFPLEPSCLDKLRELGYATAPGCDPALEHRCRHTGGVFQLFIVAAGSDQWTDYLLVRDFLRYDPEARQSYKAFKQTWADRPDPNETEYEAAKTGRFSEMLDAARHWWVAYHGFSPLDAVRKEMEAFPHPWYISSGWAIDLFLGRVTRVHHDVDVVVSFANQIALQQHLTERGWKWVTPYDGQLTPWPPYFALSPPRHQAHAHRDGAFIDFLFEVHDGVWRFRRNPSVLRALERISLRTEAGIPFLTPEVVLIYKSARGPKGLRARDQEDFESALPHLLPEARAWLRWALTATDPEHPWIKLLTP